MPAVGKEGELAVSRRPLRGQRASLHRRVFCVALLVFALIGSIGQISFHFTSIGEYAIKYFKRMGEDQWRVLLAASLVPALFTAAWSGRTAYRDPGRGPSSAATTVQSQVQSA